MANSEKESPGKGPRSRCIQITTEARFIRSEDGRVWTDGAESYQFLQRYLNTYSQIRVFARVRRGDVASEKFKRVDAEGVEVVSIPDGRGLSGVVKLLVRVALRRSPFDVDNLSKGPIILRVPGAVSLAMWFSCSGRGQPYGVELVTDPEETFSSRAMGVWWASPLRKSAKSVVQRILAGATAAAYVTDSALQKKYPVLEGPMHSYSSVEIPAEFLARGRERISSKALDNSKRMIFVGRLDRPFKGLDVLLRAMPGVLLACPEATLAVVGDGGLRSHYEGLVKTLGLEKSVSFLGALGSGAPVFQQLLGSDLFVLPSRREGLPRALIEAMAAGLPAVATNVGGCGELLPKAHIVEPDDSSGLAKAITALLGDPGRMIEASKDNWNVASRFEASILQRRRNDFYRTLGERYAQWRAPLEQ